MTLMGIPAGTRARVIMADAMTFDRDGYPLKPTWINCPDCGVGPGGDHKNGCPREKKRHASFPQYDPSIDYGVDSDPRMKLTIKDMK